VKKLAKRIAEKSRARRVNRDWAPRVQKAIALALQRSPAAFVSKHASLLGVSAGRRRRLSMVDGKACQAQGEQEGA
jgi:hypothetical protein